jgi:hypothetical protein
MEIVESIIFGQFGYLYLREFLPYIPKSNGRASYMVGNIISRPLQQ